MPDVALLTSTMAQFDQVFKIGELLKAKGSKIFLGGPYATLAFDFDPRIRELADCVVFGEGEEAAAGVSGLPEREIAADLSYASRLPGRNAIQPSGSSGS